MIYIIAAILIFGVLIGEPKENATQIQTCVTKGVALADRKFAIVCHLYGRMFQGWRGGLQNRLWWVRFPTVRARGWVAPR